MRKLALTLSILLTLVGCELAARAVVDARGFRSRHDERASFLGRIPLHEDPDGTIENDTAAVERGGGDSFVLHPYFGYTFRPALGGADNFGFYSGVPALPYRAAAGELVVGLFGGSVAMQVARARAQIVAALQPAARAAGYDGVTLLSFAVGGWRQPQHFDALVRFLDEVDVVVVLDGFNEVIHLSDWHLAQQPAEYPWSAVYAMLARQPSITETLQRADLIRAHAWAARVTHALDAPLLRSSALAHLAWRAYAARYEHRSRNCARISPERSRSRRWRQDPRRARRATRRILRLVAAADPVLGPDQPCAWPDLLSLRPAESVRPRIEAAQPGRARAVHAQHDLVRRGHAALRSGRAK